MLMGTRIPDDLERGRSQSVRRNYTIVPPTLDLREKGYVTDVKMQVRLVIVLVFMVL